MLRITDMNLTFVIFLYYGYIIVTVNFKCRLEVFRRWH